MVRPLSVVFDKGNPRPGIPQDRELRLESFGAHPQMKGE